MAVGTFLVSIFALVGVIALVGLLLYYLAKWIKTWKAPQEPRFPSDNYMRTIGSKCPDFWVYKGTQKKEDGKYYNVCENTFNVLVGSGCTDKDGKAYFTPINWDKFSKSSYGNSDRCNWIRKCGPGVENGQTNSWASWIGIAEHC